MSLETQDINDQFIRDNIESDINDLALKLHEIKKKNSDIEPEYILRQIKGFQSIKKKIPEWYKNTNLIFPKGISMQQCSSSLTAKYKREVVKSIIGEKKNIADITGGFGVDFIYISDSQKSGLYIEKQTYLADIVKKNIQTIYKNKDNLNNKICLAGNSLEILKQQNKKFDLIFADPARRNENGKKVALIEDCEPNIIEIKDELFKYTDNILVKLSPMLDTTAAIRQLKDISQVHIVSVNNECKEQILLLQKSPAEERTYSCINFIKNGKETVSFKFTEKELKKAFNSTEIGIEKVETYLYEPNSSIMKAKAYTLLSDKYLKYNLKKLEQNSHLFTNDVLIEDFPGRTFKVIQTTPYKEKKKIASKINKANITVRNFPDSVSTIRKKLKIKEGGDTYIFATTLKNNKKILITSVQL